MNDSSNIWFLEEVNLFEYFCPINRGPENNTAEQRYEKLPKRHFKKGEFIYFSEDTADKVFFIDSGAVKIGSYTPDGEEMIKTVLHAGEVFGELAVFGEDKRSDFALAMEDTELCVQERDTIIDLMKDIKGFNLFLNRLMGQRILYTQRRLESLLFKDARTRIAEYVLDQAKQYGKTLADGAVKIRNYLTHQEIANFTGTSRQTVTTVLNQLRDERLIDFDRKKIIIRNLAGMKESVAV